MQRHSAVLYPAVLLGLGVVLVLSGAGLTSGGSRAPEAGIGAAVAVAGLVVLFWWTGALALALGAEILRRRGRAAAARRLTALTPGCMRRLAAVLLGVNLLAAPCAASAPPVAPMPPAVAAPAVSADRPGDAPSGPSHSSGREPRVSPDWKPLPLPCDPGLLARPPRAQQGLPQDGDPARVVVRRGDSLWSIAAARLGPLATDADIAASWPRWYAGNASLIGPDPHLLTPGQTLAPPDPP
jgi:nucleoid-associated protein YgaU